MDNDNMKLVDGLRPDQQEGEAQQPSQEQINAMKKEQKEATEKIVEDINSADTSIGDETPMGDQYANRHTEIVKRVINRLKLQNVDLNQQVIMQIAQTIEALMKEKVMTYMMTHLKDEGIIDSVYDLIDEDAEEEMVGYFQVKQDLSVNPEDIEGLDI